MWGGVNKCESVAKLDPLCKRGALIIYAVVHFERNTPGDGNILYYGTDRWDKICLVSAVAFVNGFQILLAINEGIKDLFKLIGPIFLRPLDPKARKLQSFRQST